MLKPQHQKFVNHYLQGKSAKESYILAGYSLDGNPAESAASRLLDRADVQEAITKAQAKLAQKTGITLEMLSDGLVRVWQKAEADEQHKHTINAINSLAKMHGYLVDRKEIKDTSQFKEWNADVLASIRRDAESRIKGTDSFH